jgi:hypothetical protein
MTTFDKIKVGEVFVCGIFDSFFGVVVFIKISENAALVLSSNSVARVSCFDVDLRSWGFATREIVYRLPKFVQRLWVEE